jgi:hypothetical protein
LRLVENIKLLKKPSRLRSRASEADFRLLLVAIRAATAEIGMENATGFESLSREFQFLEPGRQGGEFVLQHLHVEAIWLKAAISDVQRQNRELCQLAEANGRVRAERDPQLEDLRGAIDQVAKKHQHELEEISGPQRRWGKC